MQKLTIKIKFLSILDSFYVIFSFVPRLSFTFHPENHPSLPSFRSPAVSVRNGTAIDCQLPGRGGNFPVPIRLVALPSDLISPFRAFLLFFFPGD